MSSRQGLPKVSVKKESQRDTHFLCFPLVNPSSIPQLAESLSYFRNVTTKIVPQRTLHESTTQQDGTTRKNSQLRPHMEHMTTAEDHAFKIIHPKAHRPPGTFHLTLGVMNLSDREDMERALDLLQSLEYTSLLREATADQHQDVTPPASDGRDTHFSTSESLPSLRKTISPPSTKGLQSRPTAASFPDQLPPPPICITLSGLSAFSSPQAARVFYAKPHDPTDRLYAFGLAIREKFREAGFITETRPLVLHATVANLRYAVQGAGGRGVRGKTWKSEHGQVDAREIVRVFDQCAGNVGRTESQQPEMYAQRYIWAHDLVIDRVAICRMGAEKTDDELLGLVYPPVSEKMI